jgi:uncharacterized repeat protein (TIGR01451 family)
MFSQLQKKIKMRHIAIFLIMLVITSFSYSQDTIPPLLLGISLDPKVVNVSDSSQVVNFTLSSSDDISGVQWAVVKGSFPNASTFGVSALRISGTPNIGVWNGSITVQNGMPVGFTNIEVEIIDFVGNRRNYNFNDLQNLGFDSSFEIINSNIQDTIPPLLLGISLDPKVVNVSDSSQVVNFTISSSDDISGVQWAVVKGSFPNASTFGVSALRISGTPNIGVWNGSITVQNGMPVGFTNIEIEIIDFVGNRRNYNFNDLQNLGFDSSFEIINSNIQDTIPPLLLGISLDPKVVNVSDSSQVVNFTISSSDDVSGVQWAVVKGSFPNASTFGVNALRISGTPNIGVWNGSITVQNEMPLGFTNIEIEIIDFVGNRRNYNFNDLRELGLDYHFEIVNSIFRVKGGSYFDENLDGCDSLDNKIPHIKFRISNENFINTYISKSDGSYLIPLLDGENLINPIMENSEFFDISPSNFEITFPSIFDTITQDFCITPKGILRQTNITVIPLTPPARPGFDASYKIVWENLGNQIESGTLNFTYDETLLDYISATQTADLKSDGIVSWYFNNLLPFEKREITVTLKVNRPTDTPAVNAGDKLYLTASILDNIFTLENTVVGSYDPNDKTCLQGDRVHPDMIGKYVDYLIRFENTGNYAAENVVIKDIIDTITFDVSTLKITDASHEVYTRIEGNKVEFIFENIQLPFDDANNDGYIAFKIKTLPSLVLGDSLKNLADIYFDYNFPIRTNEAQTTVAFPVFTKDINTEVKFYPNPVTDVLYLDTNENWTKADIYDIAGRIMRSISLDGSSIDVSQLESGTYFIRLKEGEKVGLVKFVKI